MLTPVEAGNNRVLAILSVALSAIMYSTPSIMAAPQTETVLKIYYCSGDACPATLPFLPFFLPSCLPFIFRDNDDVREKSSHDGAG